MNIRSFSGASSCVAYKFVHRSAIFYQTMCVVFASDDCQRWGSDWVPVAARCSRLDAQLIGEADRGTKAVPNSHGDSF